jgi:hypothetical protein
MPNRREGHCLAVADGDDGITEKKNAEITDVQRLALSRVRNGAHDEESVLVKLVDLGTLVSGDRIFDGKLVQASLRTNIE